MRPGSDKEAIMVKQIRYSEEYSWMKGDTKPASAVEGTIGYEVDDTQLEGEQVTVYRYLQGDWRLL
jgi:hypothetical protein